MRHLLSASWPLPSLVLVSDLHSRSSTCMPHFSYTCTYMLDVHGLLAGQHSNCTQDRNREQVLYTWFTSCIAWLSAVVLFMSNNCRWMDGFDPSLDILTCCWLVNQSLNATVPFIVLPFPDLWSVNDYITTHYTRETAQCYTHTHTHKPFYSCLDSVRDHPGKSVPER